MMLCSSLCSQGEGWGGGTGPGARLLGVPHCPSREGLRSSVPLQGANWDGRSKLGLGFSHRVAESGVPAARDVAGSQKMGVKDEREHPGRAG